MWPDETEHKLGTKCPTRTHKFKWIHTGWHDAVSRPGTCSSWDISPWRLSHPRLLGLAHHYWDGPLPRVFWKRRTKETKQTRELLLEANTSNQQMMRAQWLCTRSGCWDTDQPLSPPACTPFIRNGMSALIPSEEGPGCAEVEHSLFSPRMRS